MNDLLKNRKVLYAGVAVVVVAVAGVLIGVSLSGGDSKKSAVTTSPSTSGGSTGSGTTVAGAAETAALLRGVPQKLNVLGDPKAKVTLFEFADLQCPYCADYARDALPAIVKEYVRTGKVKLVFSGMEFLGPDSDKALRAVYAAGLQNRLWNMLDLLYKNQGAENSGWVTDDLLRAAGKAAGVDVGTMMAARQSTEVDNALKVSEQQATSAGVNSDADVLRGALWRPAPAPRHLVADARAVPRPAGRAPEPVTDGRLRAAIAALALAGAAVSAYLVYARYSGTRLACTTGGCETVQHSKYAKAAGVPVAVLGLVAYLAVFVTTFWARVEAAAICAAIVFAGLAFGIYLIVIQVAVIDAICQWCLASDAILAVLAILAAERFRRAAANP